MAAIEETGIDRTRAYYWQCPSVEDGDDMMYEIRGRVADAQQIKDNPPPCPHCGEPMGYCPSFLEGD